MCEAQQGSLASRDSLGNQEELVALGLCVCVEDGSSEQRLQLCCLPAPLSLQQAGAGPHCTCSVVIPARGLLLTGAGK